MNGCSAKRDDLRLRDMRAKVTEGPDAIDPGDVHPGDDVFDQIIGSGGPSRSRAS